METKLNLILKKIISLYKHKMFNDLLKWDFIEVKKLIEFLSSIKGNIVFS